MVYAKDLKSFALKACGFESHPGHTRLGRGGETGRRASLRSWWGNPWEFKSPPRHNL